MGTFTVGITGGSGSPYALRVIKALLELEHNVIIVSSKAGKRVLEIESDFLLEGSIQNQLSAWKNQLKLSVNSARLTVLEENDYAASIASGSSNSLGMVVVPCSMGSLARIANGISSSLIERAADVMIKEKRKLVLVTREAPLSVIHINNMLKLAEIGVEILPASPGFYHKPKTIDDLINFISSRILDRLGVPNNLVPKWTGPTTEEN
jgi:4-hydroxy-3-polyprenylbenzoate decarboxylase